MSTLFSPALNVILSRVSNETVVDIMKVYAALPSHIEIGRVKFVKSVNRREHASYPDSTTRPKVVIMYKIFKARTLPSEARYYIGSDTSGPGINISFFVGYRDQPIGQRFLRSEATTNEIVDAMQSIYDVAHADANRGRNV